MFAVFDSDWGIILIVVALLVLFGGSRLPKLFRSLGSAQAEYKRGLAEGQGQPAADAAPGTAATTPAAPAVTAAPPAVPGSTVEAPGMVAGGAAPVAQPAPPAGPTTEA